MVTIDLSMTLAAVVDAVPAAGPRVQAPQAGLLLWRSGARLPKVV